MVRGNILLAEAFGQRTAQPLDHAARVDEDQRGRVLAAQLRDAVKGLCPHLAVAHAAEFGRGNLNRQIERAALAYLDDGGSLAFWFVPEMA